MMKLTNEQRGDLTDVIGTDAAPILAEIIRPLIETWIEDACADTMSNVMNARPAVPFASGETIGRLLPETLTAGELTTHHLGKTITLTGPLGSVTGVLEEIQYEAPSEHGDPAIVVLLLSGDREFYPQPSDHVTIAKDENQ